MSKQTPPPPKSVNFNAELFATTMTLYRINKRGLSLRDAAKEIGISAATLNRMEGQTFVPEIETFYKCCKWCRQNMDFFFEQETK